MVDKSHRERGLKAAINNPRVSEKAKQRDREILETEFGEHFEGSSEQNITVEGYVSPEMDEEYVEEPEDQSTTLRVKETGGLGSPMSKSTTSSSMAGRTRSSSAGGAVGSSAAHEIGGKDPGNVIRGLKAAISNPNVSEKAKEKDRKKLRELGELA